MTKFYGIFCANCPKKFENVLDREKRVLYYIKAREGSGNNATVRVNAMMQEIASWTVTSAEYVRSSGG